MRGLFISDSQTGCILIETKQGRGLFYSLILEHVQIDLFSLVCHTHRRRERLAAQPSVSCSSRTYEDIREVKQSHTSSGSISRSVRRGRPVHYYHQVGKNLGELSLSYRLFDAISIYRRLRKPIALLYFLKIFNPDLASLFWTEHVHSIIKAMIKV